MINNSGEVLFWDARWKDGQTGWDLGGPHPLLAELVNRAVVAGLPESSSIYIPGCGRAHDAVWFAGRGFKVVAADFSATAIEAAGKNLKLLIQSGAIENDVASRIELRVEDATNCDAQDESYYQAVFDRAMYCALRPELRSDYLDAIAERLASGGFFLSLPFSQTATTPEKPKGSGPPFEVTKAQMIDHFSQYFELIAFEPRRDGATDQRVIEEFLTIWKRL